eukprot:764235-Hanusia_phi.AAC.2
MSSSKKNSPPKVSSGSTSEPVRSLKKQKVSSELSASSRSTSPVPLFAEEPDNGSLLDHLLKAHDSIELDVEVLKTGRIKSLDDIEDLVLPLHIALRRWRWSLDRCLLSILELFPVEDGQFTGDFHTEWGECRKEKYKERRWRYVVVKLFDEAGFVWSRNGKIADAVKKLRSFVLKEQGRKSSAGEGGGSVGSGGEEMVEEEKSAIDLLYQDVERFAHDFNLYFRFKLKSHFELEWELAGGHHFPLAGLKAFNYVLCGLRRRSEGSMEDSLTLRYLLHRETERGFSDAKSFVETVDKVKRWLVALRRLEPADQTKGMEHNIVLNIINAACVSPCEELNMLFLMRFSTKLSTSHIYTAAERLRVKLASEDEKNRQSPTTSTSKKASGSSQNISDPSAEKQQQHSLPNPDLTFGVDSDWSCEDMEEMLQQLEDEDPNGSYFPFLLDLKSCYSLVNDPNLLYDITYPDDPLVVQTSEGRFECTMMGMLELQLKSDGTDFGCMSIEAWVCDSTPLCLIAVDDVVGDGLSLDLQGPSNYIFEDEDKFRIPLMRRGDARFLCARESNWGLELSVQSLVQPSSYPSGSAAPGYNGPDYRGPGELGPWVGGPGT